VVVLNERERRVLARIERHLAESDPDLVRLFNGSAFASDAGRGPRMMLVVGLVLLVLGSVAAVVPIAMLGVAVAVMALWSAYSGSGFHPRLA
jgi:hypothetical protein